MAGAETQNWADVRQRSESLDSQVVGTDPTQARCLEALISHYPFIVYLSFSLWRKNLVQLFRETLDEQALPPLFLTGRSAEQRGRGTAAAVASGHYGLTGNLKAFSERAGFLPRVFLTERRPLTNDQCRASVSLCVLAGGQDAEGAEQVTVIVGSFVFWASCNNQIDVVMTLCRELQLRPSGESWQVSEGASLSVLSCATIRGLTQLTRIIFEHHTAECFEQSDLDCSLYFAADRYHLDVCHVLVKNGANVNTRVVGEEPALCAQRRGNLLMLNFFIEHGADIHVKEPPGQGGRSGLHFAAAMGHHEVLRILLQKGADVNLIDRAGETPLYAAVVKDQATSVRILVEEGHANLTTRGKKTPTIFEFAKANPRSDELQELLERYESLPTDQGGKDK